METKKIILDDRNKKIIMINGKKFLQVKKFIDFYFIL